MTDRGPWMQTYTGRRFYPLDPRPEDICLEDIAHALSMQCRFGGHTKTHYSVANHSVLVCWHVSRMHRAWGLMHDAAEAYLIDIPRPVKRLLPAYAEMEIAVLSAIARRFGLPDEIPEEVKDVDNRILHDERRNLLPETDDDWGLPGRPLIIGRSDMGWSPKESKRQFLDFAERLGLG